MITRKDEGRNQTLKNGEIYYRYGGRTQKIQAAELEAIVNKRIEQANKDWINLVQKIGPRGPSGEIILNTADQVADDGQFVVDRELATKLKLVKEGYFDERQGAVDRKLVGDVVPVDTVEVEKVVKENFFDQYPFSTKELA